MQSAYIYFVVNFQEFNYTLVAMVPSKMLSICSSVISRPSWEYLLKIFLVVGVTVALIAAALMAYVEAGSIVSSTVVATVRVLQANETPPNGKDVKEQTSKLDLKSVYDKVENRFKRNKESNSSSGKPSTTATNNNAVVNGITSGGKLGQIVANGTSVVLSNNNNAALRNRRTKKGGVEQYNLMVPVTPTTKLLDKSNQKSSSPPVEDMKTCSSGSSAGGAFSKKNKENSPSGGDGGNASTNCCGTGKKKKGGATSTSQITQIISISSSTSKKKRRNSGGGSMPNVCLVSGSSGKGQSKAEQEETSSTTTESSNSDDFYIPTPSEKKTSPQQGKGSRTSSPQDSSSSGTSQPTNKLGKKDNSTVNRKKQDGSGKLDNDLGSLLDNDLGPHQKSVSPAEEMSNVSGSGKKKNGKKKDQQNVFSMDSALTGSGKSDGKISPSGRHLLHHHDNMTMWDSPQCPLGDGLSELAAQTEAFVMHRPNTNNSNKKPNNSDHYMGSSASGMDSGRHARKSHSPQFAQALQMQNSYQIQQQQIQLGGNSNANLARLRRPPAGIIGQSRYGGATGGIISPTYFQTPNGHTHAANRQHTPPTRTLSNPNSTSGMSMTGGWGTDILPDNGCELWSRKNSLEISTAPGAPGNMTQTFSSVAGSAVSHANDMPMYSTGNMMPTSYSSIFDGFPTSVSPGLSNRSSDDGGYFSLGSRNGASGITSAAGSTAGNIAASSYATCGGVPPRSNPRPGNDSSQMFTYGMDIFNSLNLPTPYQTAPEFRSAAGTSAASGRATQQVPTSGASAAASHSYLQRMRSEPGSREEPSRGYGNPANSKHSHYAHIITTPNFNF